MIHFSLIDKELHNTWYYLSDSGCTPQVTFEVSVLHAFRIHCYMNAF